MKRILYTLTVLITISSCKSVNRMIENGDYESAVYLAKKRLVGDKKKSTKNVMYLEEAYSKLLDRDLNEVKFLADENRPENYDEIFHIYADINDRQNAIQPLLPLVSKDGYKAQFKFLRVEDLMKETSAKSAKYHYDYAQELLARAKAGDKYAAKKAYAELKNVNRYYKHYEDVEILRLKAIDLGKTRILVKSSNKSRVSMPIDFEEELLSFNIASMNDLWTEFHTSTEKNIDYVSEVEIRDFIVSPEREFVRSFVDSKEIEDGWEYFYDSNGNVAKDTLGNDIKKPKFITIFAEVTEIKREKAATVGGAIKMINANTGEILSSESFSVESIFTDIACDFRGDRRALSDNAIKYHKVNPLPFPNDAILALDAAGKLKGIMKSEMKRMHI